MIDDAYVLTNYITLTALENELRYAKAAQTGGSDYPELKNVIAVIKKAIEISGG